jgi:anti-sigma28 factor (negative regulator of flagellin synthesis)
MFDITNEELFILKKEGITMKINPNHVHKTYPTPTKNTTTLKEVTSVNNVDKIEVSQKARQEISLNKVKSEITKSLNSDFSNERINELKALVKSGKYEIKHRQVAEALIAFSETALGDKND